MRRISTFTLKLAIIAAFLIAASAFAIGVVTQNLASHPPALGYGNLKLLSIDFSRGWFSSRATSHFAWLNQSALNQDTPATLSLQHFIDHGPLPLVATTSANLQPALASIRTMLGMDAKQFTGLTALYGDMEPLMLTSRIALDGESEHVLSMPPLPRDSAALSFAGLSGQFRLNRLGTALAAELSAPGLRIAPPNPAAQRLAFSQLRLALTENLDNPLSLGKLQLSLATLATNAANAAIDLTDLDLTIALAAPMELVGGDLALKLGTLRWNDTQLGGATMQIKLTGFDRSALQRLQNLVLQWRFNHPTPAEWLALRDLLNHQPQVDMPSVRLLTPWGTAEARARILLGSFNPLYLLRGQHELWRAMRQAALDATVDAALLEAALTAWYGDSTLAHTKLADALHDGWLQQNDARQYRCKVRLQEGKLFINDVYFESP